MLTVLQPQAVPCMWPSHLCTLVPFPSLAQRPGRSREQRPVKKMILSLKINDPLVTKEGNTPLSWHSEKVVEQAALSDLKSKRDTTNWRHALHSASLVNIARRHREVGKEAGPTRGNERSGEFC